MPTFMHMPSSGGGAKLELLKNGVIQNGLITLEGESPGHATQEDGYLYLWDDGNNGGWAQITIYASKVDFSQYSIIVLDSECPNSNTYYPINITASGAKTKLSSYSRKTSFYDISGGGNFSIHCGNFENGNSKFKLYNAYLLKL